MREFTADFCLLFAKPASLGCWVKFADKLKGQKQVKFKNKAPIYTGEIAKFYKKKI